MLLLAALPAQAQVTAPGVRYDSSATAVRAPGPGALRAYQADPDFRYDRVPPEALTWWDRVKAWLAEKIFGPLEDAAPGPVLRWVFYALAALGMAYAVTRLLRMDTAAVFSRRAQAGPAFDAVEEDLQTIDFDRLVGEAVAARDYRRAVRLLYLQTLRLLAARGLIDWQRDKTNHEYVDEVRRPALRASFAELTSLFEYVWYGDFPVDETAFTRYHRAFTRFGLEV